MNKLILSLIALLLPLSIMADTVITGIITDKKNSEPLPAATVSIVSENGTKKHVITDLDGRYSFNGLSEGKYSLEASYVGYKTAKKSVKASTGQTVTANIALEEDSQLLSTVSVEGRATRAQQKGDSLIYNAEAFKVMQGSTAEDLLAKMPGIVVEGGTIRAQGEDVKKVLVDGKEFFEGDVNLAVKNLPSDIIASIEVFDKKSEQAEFTGFDDGDEIKTINIVTKTGFREGTFGELYGGYGTEDRYRVGGNVNFFNDDQRISVLGMSNNMNQQNFSQEDLAGVMSSQGGKGRRGRGGKGGGGGNTSGSGRGGSGNSASNFMVGSLGGITSTNGLGLNYVDQWNEKMKFTGSYFFNQSTNNSQQDIEREYFDASLPGMTYDEYNESEMKNWNHRFNMKFDYQIDESNSLQIRPTISLQKNDALSLLQGENFTDGQSTGSTENHTDSQTDAYNLGANITYRHRFPTEGRTLSWMINGQLSNTSGDSYTDYINQLLSGTAETESYSQYKNTSNQQYSLRSSLMFTEKLTDYMQLQANYRLYTSNTESDRKTYDHNAVTDLYEQLNEDLSNTYQSDYLTQSGGLGLRFRKNSLNIMLGVDLQWASLDGEQTYPYSTDIKHSYFSVLPSLVARYSLDRNNSFQLRYRSSSSAPSVTDLQDVIDNTNPLFLSSGNPNLDQQINHTLNLRYIRTTKSGQTFIAMLGGTFRTGYVGDSTYVATEDINLSPEITLNKGSQFTKPVNLDGYYSLQSMLTYGFPLDLIRSNINLSMAANYSHEPTIFNGVKSSTKELSLIPKVIIGSNISDQLDFTVSYAAAINKAFSSLQDATSSDYTTHTAAAKLGWTFWKGFTFRSTFNYIKYSGLDTDNSDYFLWNASIGKKFLKNNAAEIRLEAFDLLRQNQAFTRNVGSNYYDYVTSNVLEPYFMLSLVYTIR